MQSEKDIFKDKFQFFDVTADVGFRACGKTLPESFQNAALAMFEVMTDTTQLKPILERKIRIESEDQEALLYDWLSELLFLHDSENLVFSQFKVEIIRKSSENYLLEAIIWGEEFDPLLHESRDEVKAVTYHLMKVQKKKEEKKKYRLQVILDI